MEKTRKRYTLEAKKFSDVLRFLKMMRRVVFSWVPIGTLLLYNYHLEKSIIKCMLILGIISVIFNLIAIPAAAAAVLAGIFYRPAKEKKKTRQDGCLSLPDGEWVVFQTEVWNRARQKSSTNRTLAGAIVLLFKMNISNNKLVFRQNSIYMCIDRTDKRLCKLQCLC